jgi:hypothetical protein
LCFGIWARTVILGPVAVKTKINTITSLQRRSDKAGKVNEALLFALARARATGTPQWQVSALAGVNPTLLSLWVHGHRAPRAEEARRVADVLGAEVRDLWPDLPENKNEPGRGAELVEKVVAGDRDEKLYTTT